MEGASGIENLYQYATNSEEMALKTHAEHTLKKRMGFPCMKAPR